MQHPPLTLAIIIRSIIFWFIVAFSTIPYFLLTLLLIPSGLKFRHRMIMTWTRLFDIFAKLIGRVDYKIIGGENIPTTPVVIASNHQSMWETAVFNTIFPQHVWVLKRELLSVPFFGWSLRLLGPIAINRNNGFDAMIHILKQGHNRYKQGFSILAFPEGTRILPTEYKAYKLGTAKLAMSLRIPILPVAHNSGVYMPKNSFWVYPGTIEVTIGELMHPESSDPNLYMQQVESWINKHKQDALIRCSL